MAGNKKTTEEKRQALNKINTEVFTTLSLISELEERVTTLKKRANELYNNVDENLDKEFE